VHQGRHETVMSIMLPWIGAFAALLTSLSYVPQVEKAWPKGSTSDLSLKMLVALTTGLFLWVCYGLVQEDWIIVVANGVGAALSLTVLLCKIRDLGAE
jgi:MtN3 and saliva related transmembrane protein